MDDARIDALVAGYRREVRRRGLLLLACRLGALALVALYFFIGVGLGRTDLFYISINLAAVITGLSSFVVLSYYELPQVVRDLHSDDPALADASWAAIERLRGELLPRLGEALWIRPERLEGVDRPGLLALTAARARRSSRRWGRTYLRVYLLALAAFLTLLALYDPRPPGLR